LFIKHYFKPSQSPLGPAARLRYIWPMTNPGMKCTRCRGPANHRFPQHNVRFCDECLEVFIKRQVEKAIKKFEMLKPGQRVVAAISGGKDSLALWQILIDLGYDVVGLHMTLDLGPFSERSLQASQAMAERLGSELIVRSMPQLTGHQLLDIVRATRRQFCSVCGTLKRHFLNRLCLELGADTLATGHHLDDEAGRLLGNMIRGYQHHLDRQWPVLEGMDGGDHGRGGLVRKVKPLCRLSGSELKSFAKSQDLPAAYGKCPRSKGATLPFYQEAVNLLEDRMPGTKRDLYLGFLRRKGGPPPAPQPGGVCSRCGAPSNQEVCGACGLLARTDEWVKEIAARDQDQSHEA
jgi:tRNA(Ile)-lysidine synthase TilS/MesJ